MVSIVLEANSLSSRVRSQLALKAETNSLPDSFADKLVRCIIDACSGLGKHVMSDLDILAYQPKHLLRP